MYKVARAKMQVTLRLRKCGHFKEALPSQPGNWAFSWFSPAFRDSWSQGAFYLGTLIPLNLEGKMKETIWGKSQPWAVTKRYAPVWTCINTLHYGGWWKGPRRHFLTTPSLKELSHWPVFWPEIQPLEIFDFERFFYFQMTSYKIQMVLER